MERQQLRRTWKNGSDFRGRDGNEGVGGKREQKQEMGRRGASPGAADSPVVGVPGGCRAAWDIRLEGWGGVSLCKALNAKVRSFVLFSRK